MCSSDLRGGTRYFPDTDPCAQSWTNPKPAEGCTALDGFGHLMDIGEIVTDSLDATFSPAGGRFATAIERMSSAFSVRDAPVVKALFGELYRQFWMKGQALQIQYRDLQAGSGSTGPLNLNDFTCPTVTGRHATNTTETEYRAPASRRAMDLCCAHRSENLTAYEAMEGTMICADPAVLNPCPETHYQSGAPTLASDLTLKAAHDRTCTPLTVCDTSSQYESKPPTKFADRECTALTVCAADQAPSKGPTATSDRKCKKTTVCDVTLRGGDNQPHEFESHAPRCGSDGTCIDRECQKVRDQCALPYFRRATYTEDMHCWPPPPP